MGRVAEAESLFTGALAVRRRVTGNRSQETAMAVNALANFYRRTSRAARAEPLHREALEILGSLPSTAAPQRATVEADLRETLGVLARAKSLP